MLLYTGRVRSIWPLSVGALLFAACSSSSYSLGVGDHVNCALHGDNGGETNPHLDAPYASLPAALPADAKLVASHACKYKGHRVEHFVFQTANGLASLVIDPDSQAGPESSRQEDKFQVEQFELGNHIAYLVSQLAPESSRELARHLRQLAAKAFNDNPAPQR